MKGKSEMILKATVVVIATALLCNSLIRVGQAQQSPTETQATEIIGLTGLKENTKGKLTVVNGTLRFTHDQRSVDVSAALIEEVITGQDSQRVIGGTFGTVAAFAAPFGSGSALALFRKKVDTLTIQYRDADGALHGAIFTMPHGKAEAIKNELVAKGARTSVPILPEPKKISADRERRSDENQL
jgi:hypothetical protein